MTLFSKMCAEVYGVDAELDAVVRALTSALVFSRLHQCLPRLVS
jgi:hypothetical protein